ncbi:hypothetical protein [Lactobacillus mulieris]|jgi:hypothetical protein|uniref:Uncharacterized protein n=1 Tax=Lactobacillus mulieris TaxID=2508708 RepID=A0ABT4K1D2_9LACO|nr:hypothetical protein [Lactobacillus mulieris]MCZ3621886.1 hypothetical protein [Lactobacillus mulieris]MCZ3623583.1 hypothetical protein [Lactobacillus mulieris]MCZ3635893.1 hypothetical protein [Lactobacillus mulieris]
MKELELLEDATPKLTAEQLDYYRKKYLEDTAQIFKKYVQEEQKKGECITLTIFQLSKLALAIDIFLKVKGQLNELSKTNEISSFCDEMQEALRYDGCSVFNVIKLVDTYFRIDKENSGKVWFYADGFEFKVSKRYDNNISIDKYEPRLAYRVQSKIFGIEFIDLVYLKDFSKLLGFKELYEKKLK